MQHRSSFLHVWCTEKAQISAVLKDRLYSLMHNKLVWNQGLTCKPLGQAWLREMKLKEMLKMPVFCSHV